MLEYRYTSGLPASAPHNPPAPAPHNPPAPAPHNPPARTRPTQPIRTRPTQPARPHPPQTSMLSEEEFDEAARVVVAQRDWRYCRSRPDKFRYLFRSLDLDHSNQLNLNELKVRD